MFVPHIAMKVQVTLKYRKTPRGTKKYTFMFYKEMLKIRLFLRSTLWRKTYKQYGNSPFKIYLAVSSVLI